MGFIVFFCSYHGYGSVMCGMMVVTIVMVADIVVAIVGFVDCGI